MAPSILPRAAMSRRAGRRQVGRRQAGRGQAGRGQTGRPQVGRRQVGRHRAVAAAVALLAGLGACGRGPAPHRGSTPGGATTQARRSAVPRQSLQVRPVIAGPQTCPPAVAASTTMSDLDVPSPDPTRPATLPTVHRTDPSAPGCLALGPAALTIISVRSAVDMAHPSTHVPSLDLSLTSTDAAAFDAVAARYFQRQVALVMFGRVLAAPTIDATHFGGTVQVTGLSSAAMRDVAAGLGVHLTRATRPPPSIP